MRILFIVLLLLFAWTGSAFARIDVTTVGATGNCTTDDTAAINTAIANAQASGGSNDIYFPSTGPTGCYKITSPILVNRTGAGRYEKMIHLSGDGMGRSVIKQFTASTAGVYYRGNVAGGPPNGFESDFSIKDLRITGVGSGNGLDVAGASYFRMEGVAIEAFEYGFDGADVEQSWFYSSNIQWNTYGMRFYGPALQITASNSINFYSMTVGNNAKYGLSMDGANAFAMYGGSIQYNGDINCTTNTPTSCWGARFTDTGKGSYNGGPGNVMFSQVWFEGNGGQADLWSVQLTSGSKTQFTIDNSTFVRTIPEGGSTKGYAVNQFRVDGNQLLSNYTIKNTSFGGYNSYSPSASRPMIVNANSNAVLAVDGSTTFVNVSGSTVERPAQSVLSSPFTFRAYLANNQSMTNSVVAKVNFDTVDFDGLNGWDATNHYYKPKVAGTYLVTFNWIINATYVVAPDSLKGWIAKNGTYAFAGAQGTWIAPSDTSGAMEKYTISGSALVELNGVSDTVEIDAYAGAFSPYLVGGSDRRTSVSISRVGP